MIILTAGTLCGSDPLLAVLKYSSSNLHEKVIGGEVGGGGRGVSEG